MASGARPSCIALPSLTRCRASCATTTSRMTIVPGEARGQLFLPELLGLVKTHDELFRAKHNTIHCVHGRRGCRAQLVPCYLYRRGCAP